MHYKGFLITKKLPSNLTIKEILSDYHYDNEENKSGFTYDYFQVGGRYNAGLKINAENQYELNTKFRFNFYNQKRNNILFISKMLEELETATALYDETNYLSYMGLKDNCLYVDGAFYEDLKEFDITNCFLVISEDYFNVREKWNGTDFVENLNFDNEVKEIDLKNKFITIIDFHNCLSIHSCFSLSDI